MRNLLITAALANLILMGAAHADPAAEKAERILLSEFRQYYRPLLVERLQPLEEPRWKIEAKADALIKGYVDCVISAAKVAQHAGAREYIQLVGAGYSPDKIHRFFSYLPANERQSIIGRLELPIRACVGGVHDDLGILWLSNGKVLSW